MKKKSFFYTTNDIKRMKELIRTGKPLLQIARDEHASFNASLHGFYGKLMQVAKHTTKIQKWEGPKRMRKAAVDAEAMPKEEPKGIIIPEGTTFEGAPKKVVLYNNHFRIYF